MARLDPDDTSRDRWIALCHSFDASVGYRRHVVLAAFDSAQEMEEWIEAEARRLTAGKAAGEVDERDWLSGRHLGVGERHPKPQPRRRTR